MAAALLLVFVCGSGPPGSDDHDIAEQRRRAIADELEHIALAVRPTACAAVGVPVMLTREVSHIQRVTVNVRAIISHDAKELGTIYLQGDGRRGSARLLTLGPGRYSLVAECRGLGYSYIDETHTASVRRESFALKGECQVVADAPDQMIKRWPDASAVRKSVAVEGVWSHQFGGCSRNCILIAHVLPDGGLPLGVAYEAKFAWSGGETDLGDVVLRKGDTDPIELRGGWDPAWGHPEGELVLRPSAEAALRTVDVEHTGEQEVRIPATVKKSNLDFIFMGTTTRPAIVP